MNMDVEKFKAANNLFYPNLFISNFTENIDDGEFTKDIVRSNEYL